MTIEAMKQLIEDCISMMEYHIEQTRPIHTTTVAIQAAKEALKAIAEAEKQEPVLVVEKEPDYMSGGHFHTGTKPHIDPTKVWSLPIGTKLYDHPQPKQEPVACNDDVGNLEYRGNSVGYIFQKMTAYKKGIGDVWDALKSLGVHPDGKTSASDAVRNLYTHPQPKREPLTDEQVDDLHGEANRGFCIEREDYFKAFRDAETAYGITSDMKQERVDKTAKQRHEEKT